MGCLRFFNIGRIWRLRLLRRGGLLVDSGTVGRVMGVARMVGDGTQQRASDAADECAGLGDRGKFIGVECGVADAGAG